MSGLPPARPPTRPETEPPPPAAPAPAPAGASTESAVHTLDPSDLLSIDALADDVEGGPGGDDLGGATLATPAVEVPPSEVTGLPVAGSADDFSEAPTHALAGSAAAAALRPGRRGDADTTYRLDPSSIDTKPIPPVTLEPLLFDPIARADREAGEARPARDARPAERRPSMLDEDRWFEDSSAGRSAPAPRRASPRRARAPAASRRARRAPRARGPAG